MNAENVHWAFHGVLATLLGVAATLSWVNANRTEQLADRVDAAELCNEGSWCQDEARWAKTIMDCAENEDLARMVGRDCICIGEGGELEDFCNNWCQELSTEHNECYERLARGH